MHEFYIKALKFVAYKSALKNLLEKPESFILSDYERRMLSLLLNHTNKSGISDFNLKMESYFCNFQFFLKYLKNY